MQTIDMHSHFGTERGYLFQTEEERKHAEANYSRELEPLTEEEIVEDLREANVRSMLNYGFTWNSPIEEVRELHDYAEELISNNRDVFLGLWVAVDPNLGYEALKELERCVTELDLGLVGFTIMGTGLGIPPNHSSVDPFYELCKAHNVPVHVLVGYTGWGAGFDGGRGYYQDYCHPRYLDQLAADHPDLKIIASRPAWPWQSEMIASIMHKGNIVGYELHGWKPQYFPDELKDDLGYRLKDKAMFGADYPIFEYDELFEGWEELGLDDELMEKIRYKNAERIFSEHFDYEL